MMSFPQTTYYLQYIVKLSQSVRMQQNNFSNLSAASVHDDLSEQAEGSFQPLLPRTSLIWGWQVRY